MDALQKQVSALSHKVDALYQIIDNLNGQVLEALSEKRSTAVRGSDRSPSVASLRQYTYQNDSSLDRVMKHKDVLVDRHGFDSNSHQTSEKELSPEIQIKRLTAQLTAAYNRIAALEEQLLAHRFHA
ncbi:MAG: hypothetical protein KME08_14950 [Aphanothece sp. CMT-3BRIN-NPC111]|jgi:uncharacterized coiled-coil protein SlyX|nr:hypothetical protein [Aphanothece sp. CMT-3BRIN-NPC111]